MQATQVTGTWPTFDLSGLHVDELNARLSKLLSGGDECIAPFPLGCTVLDGPFKGLSVAQACLASSIHAELAKRTMAS